jgi:hypothetical protein
MCASLARGADIVIVRRPSFNRQRAAEPVRWNHGLDHVRWTMERSRLPRGGLLVLAVSLSACSLSFKAAPPEPSATTQALLLRALERAVAKLDVAPLTARPVTVEVFTQAGPENFARAFIQARLRERGLDIAPDRSQLRLQIFVGVLGTHQGENFLGIPSFAVPLIGLPLPRSRSSNGCGTAAWSKSRSTRSTPRAGPSPRRPLSIGQSKQDDYTLLLLLVISFTISDLEEREPPPPS